MTALAIALVVASIPLGAQPAYAAAGSFVGHGADIAPSKILNDHTIYAIHYDITDPYFASTTTVVTCQLTMHVGSGAYNTAPGFVWNPALSRWIQSREPGADFPQVTPDAAGHVAGWLFFKVGDEYFTGFGSSGAAWGLTPTQARLTVALKPPNIPGGGNGGGSGGGGGHTDSPTDPPIVTVLNAATQGAWVHNATPTGAGDHTLVAAVSSVGSTGSAALTEHNACDDDDNGAIDDEGPSGSFRMGVPAGLPVSVSFNGGSLWGSASSVPTDTDIAIGAADQTPPSAPTSLTAAPTADSVLLSWKASADASVTGLASYQVYRKTGTTYAVQGGGNAALTSAMPALVCTVTASSTACTDTAVTGGTTYYYYVRAVDAATNVSARSNETSAVPGQPATFTLSYTAGANGSIEGSATQVVNAGTSGSPVRAIPAAGYHFVNWSDAVTVNPRTDTNVRANVSVTASFTADTWDATTITISASPTSVKLRKPFVLSGVLTPGDVSDPCVVYVKKPGSPRFSYSSARLAYALSGAGSVWWYRYTPLLRGTYSFYARFAGDDTRLASTSRTIKVSVK